MSIFALKLHQESDGAIKEKDYENKKWVKMSLTKIAYDFQSKIITGLLRNKNNWNLKTVFTNCMGSIEA